jgi:hypothetical protein
MRRARYLNVDLENADLRELQNARDTLLKAIDQRVSEIVKERRIGYETKYRPSTKSPKSIYEGTKRTTSPRSKKINYSDTILVQNIPDSMLSSDKIIKEFRKYGDIVRIQLLRNEDDELLNSAYIVFDDPKVAQKLIEIRQPFKAVRDERRKISISPAKHLPSKEELDEELDEYIQDEY